MQQIPPSLRTRAPLEEEEEEEEEEENQKPAK